MRTQLLRLKKKNSTKGERRLAEILKRNKIKFKAKWKIGHYEADFVIGRLIVEIDGGVHRQTNSAKDIYFVSQGYVPVHLGSSFEAETAEEEIKYLIKANNFYKKENG